MRKFLVGLATFAVFFNVTFVAKTVYEQMAIAQHAKPAPAVRHTGYPIHHQAIERVKGVTVLISNEGFGGVGRGTGVLIDKVHVLTCAHMVQSYEDELWIYLHDGTMVKAKPLYGSRVSDLEILELAHAVKVPSVAIFQDKVTDGEPITIIGNALGSMRWFVSYGVISGQYRNWLLTDGFQIGGNSGGPWINEKGEIIGLAAWGLQGRNGERLGINGAISAKAIRKFLYDWKHPKLLLEILKGG